MPDSLERAVCDALNDLVQAPSLQRARNLESVLRDANYERQILGRLNQKSSIEAASESDRGITERLANAFDASLTAARLALGIERSEKALTPRNAAQRFFCPNADNCEWAPTESRIRSIQKPAIEFWPEPEDTQRFRKHRPSDGLVTILVQDYGTGIDRERMTQTILTLNSDAKLKEFEAIGQFGHGGSSALAFCESCLIITQPRFSGNSSEFYWTLVFPEAEPGDSKQKVLRKWFSASDKLPLAGSISDFPILGKMLPGTAVWHFGYNRGGWVKRIAGPEQTAPWGRLGRLFFSYPLPFEIRGAFARTDTPTGRRAIKGAFYRILDRSIETGELQYRSGEKVERLLVEGQDYGEFGLHVFVLKDHGAVGHYLDSAHPVVFTLHGQNHGESTPTFIANANLPEVSSTAIVEIRLDQLEQEALDGIVSNSRERPKNTDFTRALLDTVTNLLKSDDDLRAIERKLEDEKAKQSSADLSRKMSEFLSRILSDARGGSDWHGGDDAPGEPKTPIRIPRPPIAPADPPTVLEFLHDTPFFVADGGRGVAKFRSDARPPRYSFHGENPRLFAKLELPPDWSDRVRIVGRGDISETGYGTVSLMCEERGDAPISERKLVGTLKLLLQSTDGTTLESRLDIGVRPKPIARERASRQEVKTEILFCAPEGTDTAALAATLDEPNVQAFGNGLRKYSEALGVGQLACTYWGDRSERDGVAVLSIEVNAANEQLVALLQGCRDVSERMAAKERYVRDIVLDCYQHAFQLADTPEQVWAAITDDPEEKRRAADIHFNHDKAVRIARHEMLNNRSR